MTNTTTETTYTLRRGNSSILFTLIRSGRVRVQSINDERIDIPLRGKIFGSFLSWLFQVGRTGGVADPTNQYDFDLNDARILWLSAVDAGFARHS